MNSIFFVDYLNLLSLVVKTIITAPADFLYGDGNNTDITNQEDGNFRYETTTLFQSTKSIVFLF